MRKTALALLMATVCGCTPSLEIPVKKRWTEAVRNFALIPVYPMREDIYIGSLRLVRKTDEDYSLGSRSLGYVNLSRQLIESERQLPSYGQSGTAELTFGDDKKLDKATWSQPNSNFGPQGGTPNRLRLAALPGISLVRLSSADLQSTGLSGLTNFVLGASAKSDANLNINLVGIETLELDDVRAVEAFDAQVLARARTDTRFQRGICAAAASLSEDLQPDLSQYQLTMVTRVFYARGINYGFGDNFAASLAASAGPPGASDADAGDDSGGDGDGASAGGTDITVTDNSGIPEVALSSVAPGTAAKVATKSSDGLSQTEVFERPLAFGIQALSANGENLGLTCVPGAIAVAANTPRANGGQGASISVPTNIAPAVGSTPLNIDPACLELSPAELALAQAADNCLEVSR